MSYSRLFSEIMHDPRMAMEPRRFNAAYSLVMSNLRAGLQLEFEPKTLATVVAGNGKEYDATCYADFCAALEGQASAEGVEVKAQGDGSVAEDDTFIDCIKITGTMTRNGDDCTYGSKDHKRMMERAAKDSRCRGHILLINSGGGMVGTLMDYREAINYCLERGQDVVAVVDECAASAACFTANMTSRIFATRPTDELGSLGMFATFTTIKDGTVLPYTNEVVHIRYAPQSTDKNYELREAANGNLKPIDNMLKEDLAQILADTEKDRPSIKKEQETGKMYAAEDVIGSMVDEIGGMDAAVNYLMQGWEARKGAPIAVRETAPRQKKGSAEEAPVASPSAQVAPVTDASPSGQHAETENPNTNQPNTATKMYENIASALGLEAIEHTEDGVMLNAPLADQLEAHLQSHVDALAAKDKAHADALAQKDKEMADALAAKDKEMTDALAKKDAEIAALQAAAQQQTEQHTTAIADATTAHEQAIAQLNAEHQQAIDTLNATLGEKETALTTAQQQLDEANATIQNLEQKVTTLQTEAPAPAAGAAPADNGSEMPQSQTLANAVYQWDNAKSVAENLAAKAAFEAALSAK